MPDVPSRFALDFTGATLLGIYRVRSRIADGGMGAVYLADDTTLGRKVVVKVPHVRFLAEPGFRARFRREVSELVRLEHPHVVRVLAQGEHEEVPYFVLQYLGGGSLEDRLAHGTQTVDEVLSWQPAMAQTLDFVHQRGIVHRDVKPANVLFDEAGHVSTARDVATLLRVALRNPVIRRYAGMASARLSDGRTVESTDNLISEVHGIVAGKTGHTSNAGWSQVAYARVGRVGITAAVLGEPSEASRDADLAALLRFGLASYRPSRVVDPGRTYASVPVGWGLEPVRLVAPRALVRPAPIDRACWR